MQAPASLPLRDIHAPAAPPWWPPAPGWWMVFVALLLVVAAWAWWRMRARARRRAVARMYDDALALAGTPSARIAAISNLLRRAARRCDPQADRLEGDAWLAFLDQGAAQPAFSGDTGALLREGAYRRDAGEAEVDALAKVARARFLAWMEGAR